MAKDKPNLQTINTKNLDYSYILKTAIGYKNMENLKDYEIVLVASDEALAAEIYASFSEAGAIDVKTSYLEPAGSNSSNERDYRCSAIRNFVKYQPPVKETTEEEKKESKKAAKKEAKKNRAK